MKIRIIGHGGESQFPFGKSGPWSEFRDQVISQGHEICVDDFGSKTEALISHRHSDAAIKEANKNGVPLSRRALVLWEPQIVEKERYSKKVLEQYGIIYAPSPIWAKHVSGKSFNWPQDKVMAIEGESEWLLRDKKFVVIQGNKFLARKGELYSLRRRVIKKLEKRIDLFGTNWNKGLAFDWLHWSSSAINSSPTEISIKSIFGIGRSYRNYCGESTNKRETLSKYRYAIVIENSADFVSEKLFDCISAGCIVVYVGPKLEKFNIDDKKLILSSQSVLDVVKKCSDLMKMNDSEQYSLAQEQNLAFLKISIDWENSKVLRLLAHNILKDMT